jgi:hypothetical protein
MVNLPQMNIPDPQTPFPYGTLFIDLNILLIFGLALCTTTLLVLIPCIINKR